MTILKFNSVLGCIHYVFNYEVEVQLQNKNIFIKEFNKESLIKRKIMVSSMDEFLQDIEKYPIGLVQKELEYFYNKCKNQLQETILRKNMLKSELKCLDYVKGAVNG